MIDLFFQFYGHNIKESFDLKGSMRNRLVKTSGTSEKMVLMDENLILEACEKPLYISFKAKQTLLEAISVDTDFLVCINIR